jgi:hypothetical protein
VSTHLDASGSAFRHSLAAIAAIAITLVARGASAGNVDTFFLSNDAAIAGGAVTATAVGGGAVWYNPAGMAAEQRSHVDVNASAYLLRFGSNPDLTVSPGFSADRRKLATLDLAAVPTALTFTRTFGQLHIGAGIFTPSRTTGYPRTTVRAQAPGTTPLEVTIDENDHSSELYAGVAAGHELAPGLRAGVAVFGYYGSRVLTGGFGVSSSAAPNQVDSYLEHATVDQIRLGLQVTWGLQWASRNKLWRAGLVFRSPVFQVYEITQQLSMTAVSLPTAAPPSSTFDLLFNENTGLRSSVLRPMRVHAGVARSLGAATVSFDASLQAPFVDSLRGPQKAVVNGRAGLRAPLGDWLTLGGGLYTDLSSGQGPIQSGEARLDFYGASLGIELGSPYRVREHGARADQERSLVMGTTIAFAYAVGVGGLGDLSVGNGGSGLTTLALIEDRIVAHEFVLHLGSTLAF